MAALHAATGDLQPVREAFPLLLNEHAYWISEPKLVHVRTPTCSAYHKTHMVCQLPSNQPLLDEPRIPAGGAGASRADSRHDCFSLRVLYELPILAAVSWAYITSRTAVLNIPEPYSDSDCPCLQVHGSDGRMHKLSRYFAPWSQPRPESYRCLSQPCLRRLLPQKYCCSDAACPVGSPRNIIWKLATIAVSGKYALLCVVIASCNALHCVCAGAFKQIT